MKNRTTEITSLNWLSGNKTLIWNRSRTSTGSTSTFSTRFYFRPIIAVMKSSFRRKYKKNPHVPSVAGEQEWRREREKQVAQKNEGNFLANKVN